MPQVMAAGVVAGRPQVGVVAGRPQVGAVAGRPLAVLVVGLEVGHKPLQEELVVVWVSSSWLP